MIFTIQRAHLGLLLALPVRHLTLGPGMNISNVVFVAENHYSNATISRILYPGMQGNNLIQVSLTPSPIHESIYSSAESPLNADYYLEAIILHELLSFGMGKNQIKKIRLSK